MRFGTFTRREKLVLLAAILPTSILIGILIAVRLAAPRPGPLIVVLFLAISGSNAVTIGVGAHLRAKAQRR